MLMAVATVAAYRRAQMVCDVRLADPALSVLARLEIPGKETFAKPKPGSEFTLHIFPGALNRLE